MKKRVFYAELGYVLALFCLALGVTLMERSDFGVSMVVAPAYLLYRWLNPLWPVFSFGMAEYTLQAVLLLGMMALLRRFRAGWLFSFVTAVVYGFILDGCMALGAFLPADAVWQRLIWYCTGMIFCAAGVSLMFHTYLSPEVYELFVKEVSSAFHCDIHKFKTGYDIVSCLVGLAMSFAVFGWGRFEGVRWGTIVCALINGTVISLFSRLLESRFEFRDLLAWRPFFTGEASKKE